MSITEATRPIEIDDRLSDNDPRMPGRVLRVIGFYKAVHPETGEDVITDVICTASPSSRQFLISPKRIHLDAKVRRSGFTRLAS